jgi:hypothetical protein
LHVSFEVNLSSALAVSRNWLSAPQFNNTRTFFCRHSADPEILIYSEAAQHAFRAFVPPVFRSLRIAAQASGTALKTGFIFAYYPNRCIRR